VSQSDKILRRNSECVLSFKSNFQLIYIY